jgi:hypothetical protein
MPGYSQNRRNMTDIKIRRVLKYLWNADRFNRTFEQYEHCLCRHGPRIGLFACPLLYAAADFGDDNLNWLYYFEDV